MPGDLCSLYTAMTSGYVDHYLWFEGVSYL